MNFDVIGWSSNGAVRFLDQTCLPAKEIYREVRTIDDMVEAIRSLRVRGAPLIGNAAAMGLAAAAADAAEQGTLTPEWIEDQAGRLEAARPTGADLRWALERMRGVAARAFEAGSDGRTVARALRAEAQAIMDHQIAMCRAIGEAGTELLEQDATVLTHCNAGALATGGLGTALAVIYVAHDQGKRIQVYSCETRPLQQGARLTTWELARAGIPVTSIVDSAAASVLGKGTVDLVLTGADRIAANGDVANKIGTYGLAVLAKAHRIPFYVAAPQSTFDPTLAFGELIPIEQRSADELEAAPGADVFNPAFDVTPAELVTAIVTDRGILRPPYAEAIKTLFD